MTKAPARGLSSACLGADFGPALLPQIAAAGFVYLELLPMPTPGPGDLAAVELLGRQVRAAGLIPWTLHAPFGRPCNLAAREEAARREALGAMTAAFEQAAAYGAELVVVHSGYYDPAAEVRETALLRAVRSYNELVKRASQRGLKLALEYLPPKPEDLGSSVAELLWLQRLIDGDVYFCADVNHMNVAGELTAEALRALAPSLQTTHLSDNDGKQERHWLPGAGVIDWAALRTLLQEVGYTGPWLLEADNLTATDAADRLQQLGAAARLVTGLQEP